jgi:hypothetical protein
MRLLSRIGQAVHLGSSGAQIATFAVVAASVVGGMATFGRLPAGPTPSGTVENGGIGGSPIELRIRSPQVAPGLTDDASGPLFVEMNMTPGTTSTSCVAVTNVGPSAADVRMYGAMTDAGLARHVLLTIDAGEGGQYGDCSSFRGQEIFDGSLHEFATSHREFRSGLRTPVVVGPEESISFRLTQQLNEVAPQGRGARARFDWEARASSEPDVTSRPSGVPQVRAPNDVAPHPATVDRDPVPVAPDSGNASGPRAEAKDAPGGLELAVKVITEVAKRGWVLVFLLLLVGLFLFVQDRIDRRDPKLARARVYPDPDLSFERLSPRDGAPEASGEKP